MILEALKSQVAAHRGTFLCERINAPEVTKVVHFTHLLGQPGSELDVPDVGQLRNFVATFGSLTFYADAVTGEAAAHIATPAEWPSLHADLQDWLEQLDEAEAAEALPDWIETCLVIGEVPRTGNYVLMPVSGSEAGAVYLFDHDGFEFTKQAGDVVAYVERMLSPDDALLAGMASHMRFFESDPMVQWWIRELHDHRGLQASTAA